MSAHIFELPPALCLNATPCVAALISRAQANDTFARVWLAKNFAFNGTPPDSYSLAATQKNFAWHGALGAVYGLTNQLDFSGAIIVLDGPDLVLDDVTDWDALAKTLLVFCDDELMSVVGWTLTGNGSYRLQTVRGCYGTPMQTHAIGAELFIIRTTDLLPIPVPNLRSGLTGLFKVVLSSDSVADVDPVAIVFAGRFFNIPHPSLIFANGLPAAQQIPGADPVVVSWVTPDPGGSIASTAVVKPSVKVEVMIDGSVVYSTTVAWPATSVSIPWASISGSGFTPVNVRVSSQVDTGDAVIVGHPSVEFSLTGLVLTLAAAWDDAASLYVNGVAVYDVATVLDPTTSFDVFALALTAGITLKTGDIITIKCRDNQPVLWSMTTWSASATFSDGSKNIFSGGSKINGSTAAAAVPQYHDDGNFEIQP